MKFNIIANLFSGQEILFILIIVLIFFGGKKVPELMRGLGKGVKEFRDATKDEPKETQKKDGPVE